MKLAAILLFHMINNHDSLQEIMGISQQINSTIATGYGETEG